MKLKVVVIGGAGHIGNAVTRAFLEAGCEVKVTGRRTEAPPNLRGLSIAYLPGDANTPGQFEKWFEGQDVVVDAGAPYPLRAFSPIAQGGDPIAEAERRTGQLIDALLKSGARLVYISSFVTRLRTRTKLDQLRTQLSSLVHPYFEVKRLIETRILDAARRGIDAVIVNPTYCVGPWDLRDRQLCLIPLLLRGEVPASVQQRLNVIDVRDVAAATLKALELRRYGDPLLLGGHDVRLPDLHGLICKLGGAAPPSYSMPASLAAVTAYGLELLGGLVGQATPLTSGPTLIATMFDYVATDSALKTMEITPRPLRGSIIDSIAWYRQIGYC
jgi:dihydroflavonol-4-reductase